MALPRRACEALHEAIARCVQDPAAAPQPCEALPEDDYAGALPLSGLTTVNQVRNLPGYVPDAVSRACVSQCKAAQVMALQDFRREVCEAAVHRATPSPRPASTSVR